MTNFVRHLAERAAIGNVPHDTYAGDVYFAYACIRRVGGAVEAFYQTFDHVIRRVISHRGTSRDMVDDTVQSVYERLLVGAAGSRPKLADYAGTGPLRSWVASAAATTTLMIHRAVGRRREQPRCDMDEVREVAAQPDLDYMKRKYKVELEDAIAMAFIHLGHRDRALLRLHLCQRLSIDKIGAMYDVDRSTAARWVKAALERVMEAARQEACRKLQVSESQCRSIAGLVQSELHVSILRLLST
ncbi:sigma-70 family RNA polymerase sigma factor [Pendulispora albinea]|uniref:Sigma-70 family RNA polymerase sigma factor n=1 Tax=Pendulispora albinea TaxID=2741071 RepID=A0ABZ2LQY9_9BACT